MDDDEDYVETNFTSFPRPPVSHNRIGIVDGPQKSDTSNMSAKQEKKELMKYEKKWKNYLYSIRKKIARQVNGL